MGRRRACRHHGPGSDQIVAGVLDGLKLTADELKMLRTNTNVVTCNWTVSDKFIVNVLVPTLKNFRPDIVRLDPDSAVPRRRPESHGAHHQVPTPLDQPGYRQVRWRCHYQPPHAQDQLSRHVELTSLVTGCMPVPVIRT